ncbi:unnamed protein product [Ambrosiozyma monospora]|uniref:Unnamed protein product n=1 Tax=Ambrosiozyma monospora TaxID=43982 RepID=A0ACB5TMT3_AMBMO|nr:unnamed protein product [Ambrosiozyma monospora]
MYNNRGGRGGNRNGYGQSNRGGFQSNRGGFQNAQQSLDRANQFNSQNQVTLEITGWQNASPQEFANFVSRKTKVGLMNLRAEPNSPLLRATVKSQRDADVVVKLSGARFANDVVRIRIIDTIGGAGTNTPNTIDLLKSFIASRYDANLKMLNLEGMVHDQTLISNGLFNTATTNSKFFTALMKIALQQKIDVQTVNLAANDLNDYSKYLTELSLHFPKVKNLSLANNKISKLDFFTKVRNRFPLLRELIIAGNPIVNMNFHADIVKLFPRLVVLDGTPVRDEAKLNAIMTFPVPTAPMFFETPDLQKLNHNFHL